MGASGPSSVRTRSPTEISDGEARQHIAAAFSLLRVNKTGVAQFAENCVQEFLRNLVLGGDVGDERGLPGCDPGQIDHGLQTVFRLLREHRIVLTTDSAGMRDRPYVCRIIHNIDCLRDIITYATSLIYGPLDESAS